MINNTTLVGRLTKNPELRYTGNGIAVLSFTLAVERNYKNGQGERESDFIMCQAWRGTAEIISQFAVKGSLVGITGSIQTRNYQNNDGNTVYVTEIVVDEFQMLEPKNVTDNRRSQSNLQPNNQQDNNYSQNNQSQQSRNTTTTNESSATIDFGKGNPFESNNDVTDISDDDLPF